jgi:outer membrane protein assembly factor BamE (lipoprotein component of BamABCDE complex)
MRPARFVAALLLLILLSACTTVRVGRDFDMSTFNAKVQRGVSTQADVRGWLGAPSGVGASVEASGERFQEWNYYYGTVRIPGAKESHVKVLQIKFDGRGVVRGYTWSGESS